MSRKIANWEEIIIQHQESGKTVNEFCKGIGIHPNTFYKFRKRKRSSGLVEIKALNSNAAVPIILKTSKFEISITPGYDEKLLKSILMVIGEIE